MPPIPVTAQSLRHVCAAVLLAESVGTDALPKFDRNQLKDWAGVRSLLMKLDPEALIQAIVAFEPTQIPRKVWVKVSSQLEQASLRDAMRSSAVAGSLYRYTYTHTHA